MKKSGNKRNEACYYDGAGHGFMRAGEDPNDTNDANKRRGEAWKRWKELLKKALTQWADSGTALPAALGRRRSSKPEYRQDACLQPGSWEPFIFLKRIGD